MRRVKYIDPEADTNEVESTNTLLPLKDVPYLSSPYDEDDEDEGSRVRTYKMDVRFNGSNSLVKYGLYLGEEDDSRFIPEVIVDEDGAYVLIFKKRKR